MKAKVKEEIGAHMKAAIFDLDGTLVDSLNSITYCTNKTIARFGYDPFDKDRYRYFVGDGMAELLKRALLASGDTDLICLKEAKEIFTECFKEDCMYRVAPYPGVVDTLLELKRRGIFLAVNSNKPHDRAVDVVQTLFGDELFDMILGQMPKFRAKPSPDGVRHIVKTCNLNLVDTVYIGDTSTDMKTGKAAGIYTVGVLWGFRDRKELEENHADAIIAHPAELLKL